MGTPVVLLTAAAALHLGAFGPLVRVFTEPPVGWARYIPDAGGPIVTIRDRFGEPIAQIRPPASSFVPVTLDSVDPRLVEATLAAEDRRFFRHGGVDLISAARAALQNLRSGRRISGGSTLTQQVVKQLSSPGEGLRGKLRQITGALRLEAHASKHEILEAYLNLTHYGARERGVGAACRVLFGHDPEMLTLEEAALLASLPQSPVRLDPRRAPQAAVAARNRVLDRMPIDPDERAAAQARSAGLVKPLPSPAAGTAPHWIAHARRMHPRASEIRLPLDPPLQELCLESLRRAIDGLGARGADAGAVLAMHNPTGEVRAWVGSPDWFDPGHGQFDGVLAHRQPGSALKPFTYALAFDAGWRPSSLLPDLPLEHPGSEGSYRPRNYALAYHGPVRAREALGNSWNAPAVALLAQLGAGPVLDRMRAAGLVSLREAASTYGLGLTLGVGEVSLLELVTAYACLARGGVSVQRVEVLEVRAERTPGRANGGKSGAAASETVGAGNIGTPVAASTAAARKERRIFTAASAFFVADILSDPFARAAAFGTGGAFEFPFPVAIKTGTSSDWRDNWAVGFTPEWTVGVWVGASSGQAMDRVSGTQGAILALRPILLALGGWAFEPPSRCVRREVCALSGRPAGPDCPERIGEWCRRDDPVGPRCGWHARVPVDIATGLRARPCTPAERVRHLLFTGPRAIDPVDGSMAAASFHRTAGSDPRFSGSGLTASPSPPWWEDAFAAWTQGQGWPTPPEAWTPCTCGRCESPDGRSDRDAEDGPGDRDGFEDSADREDDLASASGASARREAMRAITGPSCRILHPAHGAVYAIDGSLPLAQQQIALEAASGGRPVRWFVDGVELGTTTPGGRLFWPLTPGTHSISAVDSAVVVGAPGRARIAASDRVVIVVEGPGAGM